MTKTDPQFIAWWIYDDDMREIMSVDFGIRHVHVGVHLMKQFVRDLVVVLY